MFDLLVRVTESLHLPNLTLTTIDGVDHPTLFLLSTLISATTLTVYTHNTSKPA